MKLAKSKKKTKVTPLMAQYNDFKQKYADAVLLFRVGDFYETFGSDAVLASKVLGITLTARNNGSSKIELAGFPHHSLDTYLPKLVRAGYRVAVCDQLEKPSKQKKIVKRGVVELVTPGITTNDNILDHKSNNFLAALHIGRKDQLGLALLDISTAEFLVVEGNTASIDKLLQNFQPAEIIYAKNQKKELLERFGERYYTYGIEDWVFMPDYSREKLLEQFEVSSLKGFGIEQLEMAQIAAGAILHYVQTTENKNLKHIVQIARIPTDRYVWMDSFTIRNLELVGSAYSSGVSLLDVMDKTISPMGSRLLRKWVLMPRKDLTSIESRHEVVQAFIDQPNLALLIADQLQQLGDLERLVAKIPLGKINPREVRQLQRSILALGPIKEALAQDQQPQLQSIAERMQLCPLLCQRVDNWLKEEPAVKTDKGGFIGTGVSEELDELRDLIANSRKHLERIRVKEAKETGIDKLKIGFNNVFGYYLEVTNRYKDKDLIPDHWVRKQTLTNSERYISEELKQLEGKILSAEEKIIALEQKLFGELVLFLNDYIRPVQTNAQLVAQLDCLHSYHVLALEQNYCRPQMHEGLDIEIKAGRHPVIEQQLKAGELYVPNDIFLDNERQQILMITGPNMSGKSALLRQTALISLMAQMGAFVPADSAKLGLIDRIFTRVGASDNISSGESTFMVEMNETASILNNISNRSLILLDEIGRGTSTYDGISIAWAIAEYLHNHPTARPKTLFATHYHELNELAQQFDRINNFHVATKELGKKVIFLRKLKAGGSEHSFGIHVAKMAGMPPQLILRASEILAQLEEQRSAQEEKAESLGDKLKAVQNVQAMQLNIFDAAPDPRFEKMRGYVEALDLNRMTPIESMLKLLEIKKMLGEEDH